MKYRKTIKILSKPSILVAIIKEELSLVSATLVRKNWLIKQIREPSPKTGQKQPYLYKKLKQKCSRRVVGVYDTIIIT